MDTGSSRDAGQAKAWWSFRDTISCTGSLRWYFAQGIMDVIMTSRTHMPLLCAGALVAAGIPFTPAPAGMFVWLDLRAAFGANTTSSSSSSSSCAESSGSWQAEADLWQHMLDVHKLVLTPGETQWVVVESKIGVWLN
jgi:hypothetical protein